MRCLTWDYKIEVRLVLVAVAISASKVGNQACKWLVITSPVGGKAIRSCTFYDRPSRSHEMQVDIPVIRTVVFELPSLFILVSYIFFQFNMVCCSYWASLNNVSDMSA